MPKATVYLNDDASEEVLEKLKDILEGPDRVLPIVTASRPAVYLSGHDLSQAEIDELKKLPGVEVIPHVEK